MGADSRRRAGGTVAHTDHGAHLLAHALVGDADGRGLGDVGVLVEGGLDLGGVDVLTAADDDVLQPVDDVEEAFVIEPAEVAGEEPAVAEGSGRGLGVVEVAPHDSGPSQPDLADIAARRLVAVGVDDLHLHHR